jgi:hypothetical protein
MVCWSINPIVAFTGFCNLITKYSAASANKSSVIEIVTGNEPVELGGKLTVYVVYE